MSGSAAAGGPGSCRRQHRGLHPGRVAVEGLWVGATSALRGCFLGPVHAPRSGSGAGWVAGLEGSRVRLRSTRPFGLPVRGRCALSPSGGPAADGRSRSPSPFSGVSGRLKPQPTDPHKGLQVGDLAVSVRELSGGLGCWLSSGRPGGTGLAPSQRARGPAELRRCRAWLCTVPGRRRCVLKGPES